MMKKSCVFIIISLLIISGCSKKQSDKKYDETPKRKVEQVYSVITDTVKLGTIRETVTGKGALYSPTRVIISPKFPGKIETIYYDEGDYVKRGEVLIQLEKTYLQLALKQAEANLEMATTNYSKAETDFKRIDKLYKSQSVSKQKYDDAMHMLEVASSNLKLAKVAVEQAKTKLDDADIVSPIDGVIISKRQDIGDMASPGVPIFIIESNDMLEFRFPVPGMYISKIKMGIPVEINIESFKDTLKLRVDSIDPTLDEKSRNIQVRVKIDNPEHIYKSGMYGTYRLVLSKHRGAVYVSKDTLIDRESKKYVIKVSEDDRALLTPVKTGIIEENKIEILSGLKKDDKVVTFGHNMLTGGEKLEIKKDK